MMLGVLLARINVCTSCRKFNQKFLASHVRGYLYELHQLALSIPRLSSCGAWLA